MVKNNTNTATKIEFDEFLKTYKPITNPNPDVTIMEDEEGNGIGFETYGIDYEAVCKANPNCVFTVCDSEIHDGTVIVKGLRHVNRVHYLITSIPCELEHLEVYFDN